MPLSYYRSAKEIPSKCPTDLQTEQIEIRNCLEQRCEQPPALIFTPSTHYALIYLLYRNLVLLQTFP
jgi:hypothetical protein